MYFIDVKFSGSVTDSSELQLLNAPPPITVTLFGIVTDWSDVQFKNVHSLIIVTPSGITTDSSLLHSENAYSPIEFTLLGIVTETRFSSFKNALSSIVVTPSGIVMEAIFLLFINALLPITVTGLPLISFGMSYDVTVSLSDLWFLKKLKSCVKVIATPNGTDYYDAIALGEKLCKDPRYLAEGGAKNVARRDGMGTTILSAVEVIGRIPDAYFQAVGSGTGAIAAWENACRLAKDGRFGENRMRVYCAQNSPFTLMYDSWKAGSRELVPITPEESRGKAEVILAKVLSNRKPPYSLAGGLFDVLKESNGDFYKVSNDQIVYWMLQFFNKEGYDILPAAACAVAALKNALEDGVVKKDETVMLNITGAGMLNATSKGFEMKKPDLILSTDLSAEEVIASVDRLF